MVNVRLEGLCAPEWNLVDHPTELAVDILVLGQPRHVLGPGGKPVLEVVRLGNVIDDHLQLGELLSQQGDVFDSVGVTLEIKCQAVIREYLKT